MRSALEITTDRVARMEVGRVRAFGYHPPVSAVTIARWQAQLDAEYPRGPRFSRVLIRYEPGDPWQPIQRFFLWQAVDPRYVPIEPWILAALKGPSPRSTGHYCGAGYCLCEMKANRWLAGASKQIDMHTWRIYHETGLYATRWWVLQGSQGGHRYKWDRTEAACVISQMQGHDGQPPVAGERPYAPFSTKVLRAIRKEHIVSRATTRLQSLQKRQESLDAEATANARATAKVLWDWGGQMVEDLWDDGLDRLPRYFEEQMGRAPIGHRITTDYDAIEERALTVTG